MPQATDIRNALADRLWTLFEAQATITAAVLPFARNKGTPQGSLRETINKMPTAERSLSITFGRGRDTLFTGRTGFSIESDTAPSAGGDDFERLRTFEAVITYREKLPTDPGAHPIQEAIEQTIFLALPVLGLASLVDTVGELTSEERDTRPDEYPKVGRVTIWRLPITTKQSALALLQETP